MKLRSKTRRYVCEILIRLGQRTLYSTEVLISSQLDILPDVFYLMVRILRLMLVLLYINSINIPPIMFINRIYENQNLLSLQLVSFLVGLRTYQHPCMLPGIKRCVVSQVATEVADNTLPLYTEHNNIKTSELSIVLYLLLARQEVIKQKQFYHDYDNNSALSVYITVTCCSVLTQPLCICCLREQEQLSKEYQNFFIVGFETVKKRRFYKLTLQWKRSASD